MDRPQAANADDSSVSVSSDSHARSLALTGASRNSNTNAAASREVTIPIAKVLAVAIENAEWIAPTIAGTNGSTRPRTSAGSDARNAAPVVPTPVSASTPPLPAREHFTLRFDYSDRRQAATQRRVEPYRIVNSGQRWYLVAWDLDREDWRTFRVDRIREGMSPGPRFTPRELTDAQVEALVSRGVPVEARRHQARVLVQARAADLAERFGPWLGTITAVDDTSCILETGADDLEMLAGYLGLLGADFSVSEPPDLVRAVRALAARYAAAT
jgi:hypothetical protein